MFKKIIGSDISNKAVEATVSNLKNLRVNDGLYSIEKRDVFDTGELPHFEPCYVIANPPYGERLKIEGDDLNGYFNDLIELLITKYNPHRLGILMPQNGKISRKHKLYAVHNKFLFKNSGIKVKYLILNRKI